jgi:glyceraldehyde 3-phosphate dehydrogenase
LKLRIAVDGFGRIGRALVRELLDKPDISLVLIHDIMTIEMAKYLLKYDSTHGNLTYGIDIKDNCMTINQHTITYGEIEATHDIDIVFVSHGQETNLQSYRDIGVKRVVLSSMPSDDIPVFAVGINHLMYNNQTIFSAGSCTTNALALLLKDLDETFCIQSGHVTSIHSYTTDQNLLDGRYDGEIERSRAAAINMIPVESGVAKNLSKLLPHLENKIIGTGVRVPTENVSMLDISLILMDESSLKKYQDFFISVEKKYAPWLKIDTDNKVSRDYYGDRAVISLSLNKMQYNSATKNLHITAWHDNEVGYVTGMVAMIDTIKQGL